jgi:hypothetical protein
MKGLGVEPYIATGREPHHKSWEDYFSREQLIAPPEDATPMVKMAFNLKTEIGKAHLSTQKVHGGAGNRSHQRDPGLSPILFERL